MPCRPATPRQRVARFACVTDPSDALTTWDSSHQLRAAAGSVRLAAIASRFDNPYELATAHFDNQLFGEKHPDGWVLTPAEVGKIGR